MITVSAYLLGMGFAGSFIGRRWMGLVDIFLHRLFKRDVTLSQYLYWKYFAGIDNPPRPKSVVKAKGLKKKILEMLM